MIGKIGEQVKRLLIKNKDIVLEGSRVVSRPLFNYLKSLNVPIKLYYIKCSIEISYKRNIKNNSTLTFSQVKQECSRVENIYNEYYDIFDGEIIETNEIKDFNDLSIKIKGYKGKKTTQLSFEI